jgi:uncharacterized membrane protein YGL010W
MTSLKDQLASYGAYHTDPRNKLTHFIGVPLVTFSLFLVLSWFRFAPAPDWPLTGATLFFFVVFLYYLRLDLSVALLQAPVNLLLLWLADRAAALPFGQSLMVFAAAFVLGWIIQLVGHAIEGKRPALADNILQIFNAPLFLIAEVLFLFGFRKDLRQGAGPGRPTDPA